MGQRYFNGRMEPLRLYNYLMLARGKLFDQVRPLKAEQYAREFEIGLGTLGRTLTHIMICEWFYVQRILEREVPPYAAWPIQGETPPPFATLEATWTKQANDTCAALASVRDWDAPIEYRSMSGSDEQDVQPMIVTASAADLFTQLVLHEAHHRAQAMNILRQLGVPAEDLDFNALMYALRKTER